MLGKLKVKLGYISLDSFSLDRCLKPIRSNIPQINTFITGKLILKNQIYRTKMI